MIRSQHDNYDYLGPVLAQWSALWFPSGTSKRGSLIYHGLLCPKPLVMPEFFCAPGAMCLSQIISRLPPLLVGLNVLLNVLLGATWVNVRGVWWPFACYQYVFRLTRQGAGAWLYVPFVGMLLQLDVQARCK